MSAPNREHYLRICREAIETAKAEQLDHATKAKADHATHLARVRAEIRRAGTETQETDHV